MRRLSTSTGLAMRPVQVRGARHLQRIRGQKIRTQKMLP